MRFNGPWTRVYYSISAAVLFTIIGIIAGFVNDSGSTAVVATIFTIISYALSGTFSAFIRRDHVTPSTIYLCTTLVSDIGPTIIWKFLSNIDFMTALWGGHMPLNAVLLYFVLHDD